MRPGALCLLVAALAAGCGGTPAHSVLSDAAGSLGKIHSGELTLSLVVSPPHGTKGRIGFELHGPFALRPGKLPLAKIAYTQIAGPREATATFISTGSTAYAKVGDLVRELPPAATDSIRRAAAGGSGNGGLGGLDLASWIDDPRVVGEGDLEHATAKLDVVDATNGLLSLLRGLGKQSPTIDGAEADRLRNAVTSSSLDLWAGKDDHLLRRLVLKARLGLSVPPDLRRVLGNVVGAKVDFRLAIARPNQPVTVAPPR